MFTKSWQNSYFTCNDDITGL